jgi:SOS-response transcriptional repressor LexA
MSTKDRSKLHEVLTQLMQEVNINEAELARKTDIPQPTLHRILSGATKSPRGTSLAPLANFFSVTINQLMGVDELPADRIKGTHNSRIYGWTPVPLINWKQASLWEKFQHELRNQTWAGWSSTDLAVSDSAFAIAVKGDAMAPTFIESTTLIIDPAIIAKNRDYVVVANAGNESASFRQLLIDGDDKYLRAINGEFRTMQLDKGNKIIGTLVQARIDFRAEGNPAELAAE